jgi:hypothetical protein
MKKRKIFSLIGIAVFLSACGSSKSEEINLTKEFESAVETAIIETLTVSVPQPTEVFEEPTSSTQEANSQVIPNPTSTATVVQLPTQTPGVVNPTSTVLPTPCYRAELVEETIPDGTVIPAGQYFSKIWIVKNTGVCEWTKDFRWTLVEGEDFGAATDLPLNSNVLPGEEIKILLELKAPLIAGAYKGIYQIFTDEGASVTPSGFWVLITVQ